jgi:hypothetical protein
MGLQRISNILTYRTLHEVYRNASIYFGSAIRGCYRGGRLESGDGGRTSRGEARSRGGGAQRRGALIEPVAS